MSFQYSIDLKDAVLELSIDKQYELSLYLLQGVSNYTDMLILDKDYSQYLRFLAIHNALSSAVPYLNSVDPSALLLDEN